ncbi:MAG: cytochrome c oxidase subunit II transmembrane domain-containing protein [Planctomycetaceae bacterium]
MKRLWVLFFMIWPVLAIWICWYAPDYHWWFPTTVDPTGAASSSMGQKIDGLFYMILYITTIVFIGTQIGLGYVLWQGSKAEEDDVDADGKPRQVWFSHGSHSLEVIWTIVPAGILLFIALYQANVWAEFRISEYFPREKINSELAQLGINPTVKIVGEDGVERTARREALAEVTARQFEWRLRYPGFDSEGNLLPLMPMPQPTDLYDVNELHLPSGMPVVIELRSQDVQHSFFVPELRIKQDAVPGLVIPVWFDAPQSASYSLTCAELCGWGHYKMKAKVVMESREDFVAYLRELQQRQFDDGFAAGQTPE